MLRNKTWNHSKIKTRNVIVLFSTIVLGFVSVIALADLTIQTDIQNARQTIMHVTLTSNGMDDGIVNMDMSSWGIYINTDIVDAQTTYSWDVLGLDSNGYVVRVASEWLTVSWVWLGGGGWDDGDWTTGNNNTYRNTGSVGIGSAPVTGKLYITSSTETELALEETNASNAANINLINTANTRMLWWFTDRFYIGNNGISFLNITTDGNVGIGTITPSDKLEINGNALFSLSNTARYISPVINPAGVWNDFAILWWGSYNNAWWTLSLVWGNSMTGGWGQNPVATWGNVRIEWWRGLVYGNVIMAPFWGNVGIWTTNPITKLHVVGTLGVDGDAYFSGDASISWIGSGGWNLLLSNDSGTILALASKAWTQAVTFGSLTTGWETSLLNNRTIKDFAIWTKYPWSVSFYTSGTQRMTITSGGNIGIWIANPSAKLDIYSSSDTTPALYAWDNDSYIKIFNELDDDAGIQGSSYGINRQIDSFNHESLQLGTTNENPLSFWTNNIERMRILSNGTIGIATATPDCGWVETAQCGLHIQQKDSYFNGDLSVVNGNIGLGYNVGATITSGYLYARSGIWIWVGTGTLSAALVVSGNIRGNSFILTQSIVSTCTGWNNGQIILSGSNFYGCAFNTWKKLNN